MAAKVTKEGVSARELLKTHQKDYGERIGSVSGEKVNTTRIPTGVFAFDMATGGGFPQGKCSIVYGPESSGKTNLCYLAMANAQRMFKEGTCVFFDVEHAWDKVWARKLGVDVDRVIVIQPDYAEQVADLVEAYMGADDVILIIVDSLAMMMTMNQAESSAEKAVVGGVSNPVQKMVQKTTQCFRDAEKEDRMPPTLIYVNQIRHKIGVMFGDPETIPGGNAPRFQSSLTVRVYGKNKMEPKLSQVLPAFKETKFVIKKWKVPIIAAAGEYDMCMLVTEKLQPGQCADWKLISDYLTELGELSKHPTKKSGWVMLGQEYSTLKECEAAIMDDWSYGSSVRAAIIAEYVNKLGIESGGSA